MGGHLATGPDGFLKWGNDFLFYRKYFLIYKVSIKETPVMDDAILRQVRRLSRPFVVLFSLALGLLVLIELVQLAALLLAPHGMGGWRAGVSASAEGINLSVVRATDPAPGVALETLSLAQRAELAGLSLLSAICGGLAVFHLRRLFILYARGEVFAEDNIRHIKRFGLWLALSAVMINVADHLFPAIAGQPPHSFANAVLALVYGGMTYVVGRVMELGRQADQERREFV